jgi:hypothetical protein
MTDDPAGAEHARRARRGHADAEPAAAFNALSEAMLAALQRELDRVAADDAARVVVIAAAGRPSAPGTT